MQQGARGGGCNTRGAERNHSTVRYLDADTQNERREYNKTDEEYGYVNDGVIALVARITRSYESTERDDPILDINYNYKEK